MVLGMKYWVISACGSEGSILYLIEGGLVGLSRTLPPVTVLTKPRFASSVMQTRL